MTDTIYHLPCQVSTKDCDSREKLRLTHLMDYLQEAAWHNASRLNFSTHDLMRHGITWVMNRMKVNVHRMPVHHEKFTVETWPAGMDKYYTQRDFRIRNEQGELLVEATSNWLVMDIKERKLIAIPDFIREARFVVDRGNLEAASGKIKFDDSRVENTKTIDVSWFDLDINDHVNNIKYYQWLLDSLDGHFLQTHELKELDVIFRHEGKYGDTFRSQSYFVPADNFHYHCLLNEKTKEVSALAKARFEAI